MSYIGWMIVRWKIFGGLYLGWGIGANDSANIFGTAIATNSISFKRAVWLIAFFSVLGAVVGGPLVISNLNFDPQSATQGSALIATLSAAIAVTIVTILGIPASTSQAAIGGIMGIAILRAGFHEVDWSKFWKMFSCWVFTPIGSAIITVILYFVLSRFVKRFVKSMSRRNQVYRILLIVSGSYGAYSLGANNVAVTTASYYQAGMFGAKSILTARIACLVGGLAIALGALTYSKNVIETVGNKITILDPFSAVVTVFAHSITLEIFTHFGIPVSSSQAIVGSIIGIGLIQGANTIRLKILIFIFVGWLMTPISGAIIAYLLGSVFRSHI